MRHSLYIVTPNALSSSKNIKSITLKKRGKIRIQIPANNKTLIDTPHPQFLSTIFLTVAT
jgi:hypothetical protein